MTRRFTLIGPGRAGQSVRDALATHGWVCDRTYGRGDDLADAAVGVDVCIVAVPDAAIESVGAAITPADGALVHLSGAMPLSTLEPHRRGAIHPLLSLATPDTGARALATAYFAVAGDVVATEMAETLSGKFFSIADDDRALYHCAAAIAANHLVALLGQVERIGCEIGVPLEAFAPLVQSSIDNVQRLGPAAALTGPAARGDEVTLSIHRDGLSRRLPEELEAYDAMLAAARRLVIDTD